MSILIKGINVKEIEHGAVAIINIDDVAYFVHGDDIVVISDHGDLIDRDALKDKTEFISDAFSGRGGFAVWGDDVLDAPVVIPAERSEK